MHKSYVHEISYFYSEKSYQNIGFESWEIGVIIKHPIIMCTLGNLTIYFHMLSYLIRTTLKELLTSFLINFLL